MVEFALVLPVLLVLFLGLVDFGRVFQSGIVIEAAARNAAEIVAEEYRRNPPGGMPLVDPAPAGDDAYYQPLHDLAARTACREARILPNTTFVEADSSCPSSPVIMLCIHDNEDTLCDEPEFGAMAWQPSTAYDIGDSVTPTGGSTNRFIATTAGTSGTSEPTWPTSGTVEDGSETWVVVPPECTAPMDPTMEGGTETSRYVQVRMCYRFTTLFNFPFLNIGDIWIQKDRVFTVAYYPPPPTPEPPPPPSPPDPTEIPTPTPTPEETPTPTPTPEETPTPTPTPEETPTPTPTPEETPTPTPEATPTPEPTP
jgi:hypothetical protein